MKESICRDWKLWVQLLTLHVIFVAIMLYPAAHSVYAGLSIKGPPGVAGRNQRVAGSADALVLRTALFTSGQSLAAGATKAPDGMGRVWHLLCSGMGIAGLRRLRCFFRPHPGALHIKLTGYSTGYGRCDERHFPCLPFVSVCV